MCIKVSGSMGYHMVKGNALTQMDLLTKEIGEIINLMELALKNMRMVHHFEEISLTA